MSILWCDSTLSMSSDSRVLALDLDGTLIDARRRQTALACQLCKTMSDWDLDPIRFWSQKRIGRTTEAALIGCGLSDSIAREIASAWISLVETSHWLQLDDWLPGAQSSLKRARKQGLFLRVVTARQHADALHVQLSTLRLTDLVDHVVVVAPATASTSKVAHITDSIAFIGDSESDAIAAQSAGVNFLAVTSGVRSGAFLRAHGATHVYRTVQSAIRSVIR